MGLGKILIRLGHMIEKKKRGPYRGKPGNKRRKLDESSYFLICMMNNENEPGLFQFNYSAFLSAARSVLQYISEEVDPDHNPNAKRGAKKWYQEVVKSPVIMFGRDERDENIHFAPASLNTHITIVPNIIVADAVTPAFAKSSYQYTSSRWKGHEDLLELCRMYLTELEALVKDGVAKRYIIQ